MPPQNKKFPSGADQSELISIHQLLSMSQCRNYERTIYRGSASKIGIIENPPHRKPLYAFPNAKCVVCRDEWPNGRRDASSKPQNLKSAISEWTNSIFPPLTDNSNLKHHHQRFSNFPEPGAAETALNPSH
jgi:hypothetical protein